MLHLHIKKKNQFHKINLKNKQNDIFTLDVNNVANNSEDMKTMNLQWEQNFKHMNKNNMKR